MCIPLEKIEKAKSVIKLLLIPCRKKARVFEVQQLCGILNFVGRAVLPGRAFTRRLYAAVHGSYRLQPHHHVRITKEFKADLKVWMCFLCHPTAYARPFLDFQKTWCAQEIDLYSDATGNHSLGVGGVCRNEWFCRQWDLDFMTAHNPSIEYLELYGVTVGIMNWIHMFKNKRIILFCDNQSVVHMINNMSSRCKNCMVLIRLVVLQGMLFNVRIFAKHVAGKANRLSDLLSRQRIDLFKHEAEQEGRDPIPEPVPIPEELTDMEALWVK